MSAWIWIAIIIGVSLITACVTSFIVKRRDANKVGYMFDAFEDGEVNFHFRNTTRFNKTLNRLHGIYEKQRIANEQESWTKLIRVLTHEIMNTLTPVVSLSDALIRNSGEENESSINIKEGLEIISDSSKNLMEFVGTYRQITGISKPVRKKTDLNLLLEKNFKLNEEVLKENNITYNLKLPKEKIEIHADEVQINQVLQNLLKNALQAHATIIKVTVKVLFDGTIVIWYANNGFPIPSEIKEQIFIPFYTTKSEGTGIGLSVCRQIMRYHNGSIYLFQSNSSETIFELTFF